MGMSQRFCANAFGGWFQLRRSFPPQLLDDMAKAIADGERAHRGEVCFAVESRLAPLSVLEGLTAKRRAEHVFAQLRVWDTEHNNGVLFYVLMAEHRIEIIADRGIVRRVHASEWNAICDRMRMAFARGEWRDGALDGIAAANALLTRHFPSEGDEPRDELPNRPVVL